MVLLYMVTFTNIYHQYTPFMLAYIPAPAGSVMAILMVSFSEALIAAQLQWPSMALRSEGVRFDLFICWWSWIIMCRARPGNWGKIIFQDHTFKIFDILRSSANIANFILEEKTISELIRKKLHELSFIELDDGKIYRKALYLMVKTMVSCKISLKPIQWIIISQWWAAEIYLIFVPDLHQGDGGFYDLPAPAGHFKSRIAALQHRFLEKEELAGELDEHLTIWLWLTGLAMENHHAIKFGKPSISIRAIYTMAMFLPSGYD